MPAKIEVGENLESWSMHVAAWLVDQMNEVLTCRDRVRMVLPGGTTPRGLLETISGRFGNAIEWSRVDLFQTDERWVHPTDTQSNQRMIREALGSVIRDDGGATLYTMNTLCSDPVACAQEYHDLLNRLARDSDGYLMDMVLLGMGDDCHVASIFPGDLPTLHSDQWCVATWVEKLDSHRITLTPKALTSSRTCAFLVTGKTKTESLAKAWQDGSSPHEYPAVILSRHPSIYWFVDQAALGDNSIPSSSQIHRFGKGAQS